MIKIYSSTYDREYDIVRDDIIFLKNHVGQEPYDFCAHCHIPMIADHEGYYCEKCGGYYD
jgi:hypothetical protein